MLRWPISFTATFTIVDFALRATPVKTIMRCAALPWSKQEPSQRFTKPWSSAETWVLISFWNRGHFALGLKFTGIGLRL